MVITTDPARFRARCSFHTPLVFTPPWFLMNLESSSFFIIWKYFLTRHHLLKDVQVEEVHEGEQTSSKALKNVTKDDA